RETLKKKKQKNKKTRTWKWGRRTRAVVQELLHKNKIKKKKREREKEGKKSLLNGCEGSGNELKEGWGGGGDRQFVLLACPAELSWPPSGASSCFGALRAPTPSWSPSLHRRQRWCCPWRWCRGWRGGGGASCCCGLGGAARNAYANLWDLAVGRWQWQVLSGVTGLAG
uniref:Uncharacterized protein n=1 Tax=Mustela putorius furo TaxID=9669 RepID=M3Y649_MUSPF